MLNLECPWTSYRRSSALPRKWSINPNTFPHTQLYCHHICKNWNMKWAQSRWHKWHIPIQAGLLSQNSDGHMGGQVHLIEWQSTNPGISGDMRAWHCCAVRAMVSVPVRVEVMHWVSYARPFLDTHTDIRPGPLMSIIWWLYIWKRINATGTRDAPEAQMG